MSGKLRKLRKCALVQTRKEVVFIRLNYEYQEYCACL
jgi:hypothetical protein